MQLSITAAAAYAAALFFASAHNQRMISVVLITLAIVLTYVAANEVYESRPIGAICAWGMACVAGYYAGVVGGAW